MIFNIQRHPVIRILVFTTVLLECLSASPLFARTGPNVPIAIVSGIAGDGQARVDRDSRGGEKDLQTGQRLFARDFLLSRGGGNVVTLLFLDEGRLSTAKLTDKAVRVSSLKTARHGTLAVKILRGIARLFSPKSGQYSMLGGAQSGMIHEPALAGGARKSLPPPAPCVAGDLATFDRAQSLYNDDSADSFGIQANRAPLEDGEAGVSFAPKAIQARRQKLHISSKNQLKESIAARKNRRTDYQVDLMPLEQVESIVKKAFECTDSRMRKALLVLAAESYIRLNRLDSARKIYIKLLAFKDLSPADRRQFLRRTESISMKMKQESGR